MGLDFGLFKYCQQTFYKGNPHSSILEFGFISEINRFCFGSGWTGWDCLGTVIFHRKMPRQKFDAVHRYFTYDSNTQISKCELCGRDLKVS